MKFFHRKVESFEEVSWGCGEHEAGISAAEGAVRLSPPKHCASAELRAGGEPGCSQASAV